jgi:hypothetical protein
MTLRIYDDALVRPLVDVPVHLLVEWLLPPMAGGYVPGPVRGHSKRGKGHDDL